MWPPAGRQAGEQQNLQRGAAELLCQVLIAQGGKV